MRKTLLRIKFAIELFIVVLLFSPMLLIAIILNAIERLLKEPFYIAFMFIAYLIYKM